MPRCHRGRKGPGLAGHDKLKIKSHATRNEDETAAQYESQTDSALESNSTAGSGSQSKEEAGSEAPLPLTTGKGKRHGDLFSHRFSQSEKVSDLTLSNGLSSCHDSAVSSCDGVSSCSSPSYEALSVESGCVDQDNKLCYLSDSFSCAAAITTPLKPSDALIIAGRLSRKNARRRRQRKYKRQILRQKREMAEVNARSKDDEEVEIVTQGAQTEVSDEVIECTATPAVSSEDQDRVITTAIINDNLHDLNGRENTRVVDHITSPREDEEDIVIHELGSEERGSGLHCNIPRVVVEDTSDTPEETNNQDDVQEDVLLGPSEKLELFDVLEGEDENDSDIAIYEIQSKELVESEEDDESGVHTEDSSEANGDMTGDECPANEAVTVQPVVEKVASSGATKSTVDAALAELDSIPDEVCESGDVDEEDEEEEEWSYYRMDLQTQPQGEDVLVQGSSEVMDKSQDKAGVPSAEDIKEQETEIKMAGSTQEFMEESRVDNVKTDDLLSKSPDLFQMIHDDPRFNKETNLMESSISNVGEYLDNYEAPSSPPVPGSPRSVEGFVTSVELNTAEEISGAIHTQEMNGGGVEQSSGPFSVYVSSSPEPVSLDPHLQASGDFSSVTEMTNGQVENDMEPSGDFSPVEIVHAQSTVEVVASPTPSEKREDEMPDLQTSPTVSVNQAVDVTFIPEPALEPSAEKPVPVFIDEGTPVSEGEPEIPSDVLADMRPSEPVTADLLSNEPSGEAFVMDQTCTVASPIPDQLVSVEGSAASPVPVPSSEPLSPVLTPVSPFMEQAPVEAEVVPSFMEPSLLAASPTQEPSPAPTSPFEELIPAEPLSAPMSPVQEPSPAPMSPVQAPSPSPMSPVQAPSPAPMSPVPEPSAPMSPVPEPFAAPMSPVPEPFAAPMSPVPEPFAAPMSPVQAASPVPEPSAPMSPLPEPSAPMSPVPEPSAPMSPVPEPFAAPISPVPEPFAAPISPVQEPTPASVSPVEETTPAPVLEPSPIPVPEVMQEAPSPVSPVVLETQTASPSVVCDLLESAPAMDTEKDEILINKGTVIIPVVAQEEVKETKPEVAKSPAKSPKTPGKVADKAGKATPTRSTPAKATPSRTTPARTPLAKSAEKKPTSATRPAPEKTAPARSRTTPTSSAPSKAPLTKPSTRPAPRPTATKPSTTTTGKPSTTKPSTTAATKPAEKKAPKPAAPTPPRAALSKPSAAASRPIPAARTSAPTTTAKRPVSAPTKRVEKTDTTKLNGTATKPAPRTTTTRPTTASSATRKPLSATAKSVPEKETKNTTNRILSTTTKSAQRPLPGSARLATSKTTTLTKTAGKVDGTSSTTTTTSKARMTSATKSSTTTKTTGVAAKKTLVSKTSTTKTKAAAAASSTKVQKSEVISAPVTNGENKIAHEETSVEVIEKCAAEDVVHCSTTEQVISTETMQVIVNGDH